MNYKYTLGVIGAGNMAKAITDGIISKGVLSPSEILVSDVDETKLASFTDAGMHTCTDNTLPASESRYLLLAVKPQTAPAVFDCIRSDIASETVISIMAGIKISRLAEELGERNYARIMPNTPAMVGAGMAAVAFSEGYNSRFITDIFDALGKTAVIDESAFDAVTSLSGSGPAYVYMFIKALIDGGRDGGLDEDTARTLALQTVRGAAAMIEKHRDTDINDLINAVCSKGGTTIQAVEHYRACGLEETVIEGMRRCRRRSEELSK